MNGAAIACLQLPEQPASPPAVTEPLAIAPDAILAKAGIEVAIGEATASAVAALSRGLLEYLADGLTGPTRTSGGDAVAAMYELQQSAPELDYAAVARRQGMLALRARFGDLNEPACDALFTSLFEILAKVTATMRAEMN